MVVQMTRKEYEAKYGSAPTLQSASKLDISVAPRVMTRKEYDEEYGVKEVSPMQQPIKALEGISSYGDKVRQAESSAVDEIKKGFRDFQDAGMNPLKMVSAGLTGAIGAGRVLTAPIAPLFEPLGKGIDFVGDKTSNSPEIQAFANSPTGEKTILGLEKIQGLSELAGLFEGGLIKGKVKPKTVGATTAVDPIPTFRAADTRITNKVANEIYDIENNYNKLRNNNEYAKDAGAASRQRIAQTDVLSGAVDTDGVIRTKQKGGAVEQYRKQNIDGVESVVKDLLKKEDTKVNLNELQRELNLEVYRSGLEGADLVTALKGVTKEIQGLSLRADEFGNIPLSRIHDAKISTTRNIDFNTPPETKTYRKAVARTYKNVIENKSTVEIKVGDKTVKVKDINAELAKYYEDIERLEALDGRRVKGGRLGKYTAQISGNIIGGMAGAALGPLGMMVGPIIGGEAAGFVKGRTMASTFGKNRGAVSMENPILTRARKEAGLPPVVDLSIPDGKVGVAQGIPKTKEITAIESQIAKNVEAQKKAIKAKDFTLVSTLKEIYANLVAKLKEIIKTIKETPNKEGGFVAFGKDGQSNSLGKRNTQYNTTKMNTTTNIDKNGSTNSAKTQVDKPKDAMDIRLTTEIKDSISKELADYDTKPLTIRSETNLDTALPDDKIDMRIEELKIKSETKSLNDQEYKEVYGLLKTKGIDAVEVPKVKTTPTFKQNPVTGKLEGSVKAKIDERLAPLADKDGMVTVYRASSEFPDTLPKDTFVSTKPDSVRYYAESWYKGNPKDIQVKSFKVPANKLKRAGSVDNWQLNEDFSWNKANKK